MPSPEKEIRLELASHLEEQEGELVRQGVTQDQARLQALELFGDVERHLQATVAVSAHSRFLVHPTTALLIVSLWFFMCSWILVAVLTDSTGQFMAEKLFVWGGFLSLAGLGLCLNRFLMEYFGLKHQSIVYASLLLSSLLSFSLTALLDVNNFEVTLHLLMLAVALSIILHFVWKRQVVSVKQGVLYLFSLVAVLVAATEQPLFGFLSPLRCVFIQSDSTPLTGALSSCQQLPLWHPLLLILYALVIGGGAYLLTIVWSIVKNKSTQLYKKIILVASLSSLGVMPVILPDMNKYGELDIIPWKIEIYTAYEEILGRQPEQKDIDFYARSKAYQDMLHLKEVLYESAERKVKIDLVYQEILKRPATSQEIQLWNEQQSTVEEIRDQLTKQIL